MCVRLCMCVAWVWSWLRWCCVCCWSVYLWLCYHPKLIKAPSFFSHNPTPTCWLHVCVQSAYVPAYVHTYVHMIDLPSHENQQVLSLALPYLVDREPIGITASIFS